MAGGWWCAARQESLLRLRAAHDAGEQPLMPVRLEGVTILPPVGGKVAVALAWGGAAWEGWVNLIASVPQIRGCARIR